MGFKRFVAENTACSSVQLGSGKLSNELKLTYIVKNVNYKENILNFNKFLDRRMLSIYSI